MSITFSSNLRVFPYSSNRLLFRFSSLLGFFSKEFSGSLHTTSSQFHVSSLFNFQWPMYSATFFAQPCILYSLAFVLSRGFSKVFSHSCTFFLPFFRWAFLFYHSLFPLSIPFFRFLPGNFFIFLCAQDVVSMPNLPTTSCTAAKRKICTKKGVTFFDIHILHITCNLK